LTPLAETAVIAMSGGVDSSVAALLMREAGYACTGVTMRLADDCAPDIEAARAVATQLSMPLEVVDLTEDFTREVIAKFVASYEAGETPNPCIDCNRELKFGRLLAWADERGAELLATGHYARTRYDATSGRWQLLRAADITKDQSYVLYSLTQAQLARVRFPLGELSKSEARERATAAGLPSASSPESQDICFVPDGDYAAFIERWRGAALKPGDILDAQGRVIGRHRGVERYTIGQRKGLEVAAGHPVYVIAKDAARGTITLGEEEQLYHRSLIARAVNWVSIAPDSAPLRAQVKTSYRSPARSATITPLTEGRLQVDFDEPVRGATPGQAVVAYDGDLVLAGATIT